MAALGSLELPANNKETDGSVDDKAKCVEWLVQNARRFLDGPPADLDQLQALQSARQPNLHIG